VGYYAAGNGSISCTPCDTNEFSVGGGSPCLSCPAHTTNNTARSACIPCPIGQYRNEAPDDVMDSCEQIPCLAGEYCITPTSKALCPLGTFCLENAVLPTSLSYGHYAIDSAAQYTTSGGVGQLICEEGFYCSGGTITLCEVGWYCPRGSGLSLPCPPGTHTQFTGEARCEPCPAQGVNCLDRPDGRPVLPPGFWRFDDALPILEHTGFYSCPACRTADASRYTFKCNEGHDKASPICGACLDGYWMQGDACAACAPASATVFWCLLAGAALVLGVLGAVGFKFRRALKRYGKTVKNQLRHHKVFIARIIVLYQILQSISDVYRLDDSGGYPDSYTAYIRNPFFGVLSLDVLGNWSCAGFDFYDKLLLTTLLPTAVLCLCACRERLPLDTETLESVGYFVATVSLVPISTVVFQTFACSEYQVGQAGDDDDFTFLYEYRLRADLRVDCDSATHQGYQMFAGLMMLMYPLGIPFMGALLLLRNKGSIEEYLQRRERLERSHDGDAGAEKVVAPLDTPETIRVFKGIFEHYRPEFFAWGILDMLYGLLLTGFAVLFEPGSMMQIVVAFLIAFVYYALHLSCQPYHNAYHNFLVALVDLNVVVTIFASVLVKVDNEVGDSLGYESGYDISAISALLVFSNALILVEFVGYCKRAVELATGMAVVVTSESEVAIRRAEEEAAAHLAPGDTHPRPTKTKKTDPTAGLYFPRVLNGTIWEPFPNTNTYRSVYNLLSLCARRVHVWVACADRDTGKASLGVDHDRSAVAEISSGFGYAATSSMTSWSPWWDVAVFVNDTSGWILRRTAAGWEIAPSWSAGAEFVAKGATRHPPSSGWETVDSDLSMVDISSVSVPLRLKSGPVVPSSAPAEGGAGLHARSARSISIAGVEMEIVNPIGGEPTGGEAPVRVV
jgi:hypothetical protein